MRDLLITELPAIELPASSENLEPIVRLMEDTSREFGLDYELVPA